MVSRRTALVMSVTISILAHGTLVAVAPRVPILRPATDIPDVLDRFRVSLVEPPTPLTPAELTGDQAPLSSPTAVKDLLARGPKDLEELEPLMGKVVGVPLLEERVASEEVSREYDLARDERILEKVDAKIIEISEQTARKDIEVVRRLVRPSPDRTVGEGEYPVLRAALDQPIEGDLSIRPLGRRLGSPWGEPGDAEALGVIPERDEGEGTPEILEPEDEEPTLPELPIEELARRTPLVEEIGSESAYEFIDDLVDITLDTAVAAGAEGAFFQLRIVPKAGEDIEVLPKDITFVVDASRSIPQYKLNNTVAGLRDLITALRPEDRFNVVIFRDSATPLYPHLVPATPDNKAAGIDFLSDVQSRGETDVYQAIRPVVLSRPREGIASIVVVATDGRPTAGLVDAREIINTLTADNTLRNTIFAYGAGRTVNHYLLDLLAYRNKGESYVTPDPSRADEELPEFVARLNEPILVDCKVDYGAIDEVEVYPKEIPDFYRGRAVTIYGRFAPDKDAEFAIRLTGKAGDRQKEVIFKADLRQAATGDEEIARKWAFSKIYHVIGEICRVGETPELLGELRRLSQQYGIKTSYD